MILAGCGQPVGPEVRVSGKFLSDGGVFVALVVFVQSEHLEGKLISIEQGDGGYNFVVYPEGSDTSFFVFLPGDRGVFVGDDGEVDLSSSPICASVLHVQCASFWIWRSAALRSN